MGNVFNARELRKSYWMGEVEVPALRGIDLSIDEGELCVLLGQSGSGKTTLMNILGGLDVPTTGTVAYRGRDLSQMTEAELTEFRRAHVGFVFQMYNLIPSLTAEENISLVTEIADDPMVPKEALELVGLVDRAEHFPAQMSGGEQQRVAIARALAKRPGVLLCDEPTGALDIETGKHVLQALDTARQQLGTTVLMITHNRSIGQMASRVVSIADGRIARDERNEKRLSPQEIDW